MKMGGKLGPCGVKHGQMSLSVSSHCGLHYRALPGEGVFHVKNVIGSIKAAVHYLSVTSCLTSKDSDTICITYPQQKQASTFRVQQLVSSFSLAKRNILLNHNQVDSTVFG